MKTAVKRGWQIVYGTLKHPSGLAYQNDDGGTAYRIGFGDGQVRRLLPIKFARERDADRAKSIAESFIDATLTIEETHAVLKEKFQEIKAAILESMQW